jgi:hypothetical protein
MFTPYSTVPSDVWPLVLQKAALVDAWTFTGTCKELRSQRTIISDLTAKMLAGIDSNDAGQVADSLSAGALVKFRDASGRSPIYRGIIRHGEASATTVRLLMSSGADPVAVHYAAQHGLVEVVHELVKASTTLSVDNGKGRDPLQSAARYGQLEVVRELVKAGAALDTYSAQGWTPLNFAARNGHAEVVRELVKAGAAVETYCAKGWTPLHYAARYGHVEVVQLLVGLEEYEFVDKDEGCPDCDSCHTGQLGGCNGCWTPLMLAMFYDHDDVCSILVTAGACEDDAMINLSDAGCKCR